MRRKKIEEGGRHLASSNKPTTKGHETIALNTTLLSDTELRQLIMFDDGSTMSLRPDVSGDITLNSRQRLKEISHEALDNLELMVRDYDFVRHSLSPSDMTEVGRDKSGRTRYSWSYCKRKVRSSLGERPLDEFINADGIAVTEYTTMHDEKFDKFEFCRLLLDLINSNLSNTDRQNNGNGVLITLPKSLKPFSWLIHYHLAAMFGDNVSVQTVLNSGFSDILHSDVCIRYSAICDKCETIDRLIDTTSGLLKSDYCMIPDQRSAITSSVYHVTSFLIVPDQAWRLRLLVTLNGSTLISKGQ